jgi:hypothetical protein
MKKDIVSICSSCRKKCKQKGVVKCPNYVEEVYGVE